MRNISVLDCTLRDGGYCNQWKFGSDNIPKIIDSLVKANIEIIECGFLTDRVTYDPDSTRFTSLDKIAVSIPDNKSKKIFVVMMNYGEYDIQKLPDYDGSSIDGIRVAFHKKDLKESLDVCKAIKAKGYKVFIQAMVSLDYKDEEFLSLIRLANEIKPFSFYIVDSFGTMKEKDLIRLFYMIEHNLNESISIGFHSHNNLQLAYSNAQTLATLQTKHNLVIDSSIYGMGRGAGNLNTELFVEYLNDNFGNNYKLQPLLNIIDRVLNNFYLENYWGYSLPNYLSAVHNIHPNYAQFLDDKKTLTVENMNDIFSMMDSEKKVDFDKQYITDLLKLYMERNEVQEVNLFLLRKLIDNRNILIIAPGKTCRTERDKIEKFILNNNPIIFSINFEYDMFKSDFIFISNHRRFRELNYSNRSKVIATSNINTENVYLQVKYSELTNQNEYTSDNAGLMFIKFLINIGIKKVWIAGMDGYSHNASQNFADTNMSYTAKAEIFDSLNEGMNSILNEYSKKIELEFLTTTNFEMKG